MIHMQPATVVQLFADTQKQQIFNIVQQNWHIRNINRCSSLIRLMVAVPGADLTR